MAGLPKAAASDLFEKSGHYDRALKLIGRAIRENRHNQGVTSSRWGPKVGVEQLPLIRPVERTRPGIDRQVGWGFGVAATGVGCLLVHQMRGPCNVSLGSCERTIACPGVVVQRKLGAKVAHAGYKPASKGSQLYCRSSSNTRNPSFWTGKTNSAVLDETGMAAALKGITAIPRDRGFCPYHHRLVAPGSRCWMVASEQNR